jgi:dTDP-4-amino-4,6-dideoxygalactose transaminase
MEKAEWQAAAHHARQIEAELGLTPQPGPLDGVHPYWVVSFADAATASTVESVLSAHNIETRRWWSRGCHRMPAFQGVSAPHLAVTDLVAGRTLGLPMYRGFGAEEAERVRDALVDAIDACPTNL